MERILRNTGTAISVTVLVDGTATNPTPDSATVTIVQEDGTVLVGPAASTTDAGTGEFSYNLTTTHTADLNVLTATWSITRNSLTEQLVTHHEIVGGHVCSLAQIDANLGKAGDSTNYSLPTKRFARDVATDAFEEEAGVAFTPRYRRVRLDGDGRVDVMLPFPRPLAVISGTVDGTALTVGQLADLEVYDTGVVYSPAGWLSGRRNVVLKVEHGFRSPPADVSRAVAMIAASVLKDGPFDDRGYAVTEDGGAVRLLTAGIAGAAFSLPDVQAALARHAYVTVP